MTAELLCFHPDQRKIFAQARRQLPGALVALAAVLLWQYLRFHDLGWDGVLVTLLVLMLGGQYLLVRVNASLFVDGGTFGETSPFRRKHSLDLAEVQGVERVTIRRANQAARQQFLILGPNGAVKMRVNNAIWSDADLGRLWERLRVTPTGSFDRVLTYREFKRAYGDR